MDELLKDLQYSFRTFLKSPGFTLTALAALTLGIGANTAIFSVVNTVLLRPLVFPDPDRIVSLMNVNPQGSNPMSSPTKFNLYRAQTNILQDVAAYHTTIVNLTGGDKPEQVPAMEVSEAFFRLFGNAPVLGRSFTPEEDLPKGGNVIIISDGLWKRRYASDPNIVGRSASVGGDPYTIIGVLPPFADKSLNPVPDVVKPFQIDPQSIEQGHYFQTSARLKPGISLEQANARMKLAAEDFRAKFPLFGRQGSFGVTLLEEVMVRNIRPSLLILSGAVGLVLLIACANVANLLLVRASTRRREIAIRTAVGAGRGRIIRQLLTESVTLSLIGGVLGIVLGSVGIRALLAAGGNVNIPRTGEGGAAVSLDWRVVLFTVGISVFTGILFGLIPAFEASRTDLNSSLKESSGRSGSGFRQNKARSVLVVVETALALVLLIGSALLIRTFIALHSVHPGYDTHNILTMRMSLSGDRFLKTAGVEQVLRDGIERIRAIPGVELASATCCTPLEGAYGLPFNIVGRAPVGDNPNTGGAGWITVSPGFFEVFKYSLIAGRTFTDRDDAAGAPVVMINQSMAKTFWKDGDPLKDQIVIGNTMGPDFKEGPRQIIGVVGDVRDAGLSRDPGPEMYVPNAQIRDTVNALNVRLTPVAWVIRTKVEPYSLSNAIQREIREASGGLPAAPIRTMDEIVARSTAQQDFNMMLLTIFGASALILAAIGIYGLMAYSVEQRTQEIGIRMALGAASGSLRNMVVGQGMVLALIGIAIGLGAAYGLTRLLATLLFQVKPLDPMVFTVVPVLLTLVALMAIWFPARRATRVDPVLALRME
jgi:predicted permease